MRRVSKRVPLGLMPLAAVLAISAGSYAQTPNYTPVPVPTPVIPQVTAVGGDNAPRLNDRPIPNPQSPASARGNMAPLRLLDPPAPVERPAPQRPVAPPPAPSPAAAPAAVMAQPDTAPPPAVMPRPVPPVPRVEVTPLPAPPAAAPSVPAPAPAPDPAPARSVPEAVAAPVTAPPPPPPVVQPKPAAQVIKAEPAPAKVAPARPVAAPKQEEPARPVESGVGGSVRVKSDAYVRARPDRKSQVVTAVSAGETFQVFAGGNDDWISIGQNGKRLGFVSADLVARAGGGKATGKPAAVTGKPSPGNYEKALAKDRGCALPKSVSASPRKAFTTGMTVRVLAATNLRVAPACDAKVRDVLETGERVTVMAVRDGWYQVGRKGKALGYVGGALLTPAGN